MGKVRKIESAVTLRITVTVREAVLLRSILRRIRGATDGPMKFVIALDGDLEFEGIKAKTLAGILDVPDTEAELDALPDES